MTFVLDTSILIDLEHKDAQTIKKLKALVRDTSNPVTTFLNQYEFLWGLRHKGEAYKDTKSIWLQKSVILQTSRLTPFIICSLRQKHEQSGLTLPLADWLIASLTIENNMVLVTKDKDFEKIEELKKIIL